MGRMRRMMMLACAAQPKARYLECEYIESTGAQWLDTGMYFNSSTDVLELEFYRLDAASVSVIEFGLRDYIEGTTTTQAALQLNYSGGRYRIDVQDKAMTSGIGTPNYNVNQWATFKMDFPNKKAYWNDTSYDASNYLDGGYDYKSSLWICWWNRNGGVPTSTKAKARYKYVRQYRNGTLYRNLMPVYDTKLGVYGMLETISKTFIRSGTGTDFNGLIKS